MADEEDMLNFFMEHQKLDIELSKIKMFHGFQKYTKGLQEAYATKTKGMTKEAKAEYDLDLESGEGDNEWDDICGSILNNVQKEYNFQFDIEHDDMDITLSSLTEYFFITCHATVYDSEKKMSELEFEVELNDKSHFMIDLCNKLILKFIRLKKG